MIGARLSVMMFLQFFIWGSWYVTTGNFLELRSEETEAWGIGATIYALCPIAAMISPIFLGMIADRFFATQKVLGVMQLLGGVFMVLVAQIAAEGDGSPDTYTYLLLAHALCFMPTLGLSNTLALHNVVDAAKHFPMIRVFGTLGWIAANYVVSLGLGVDGKEATVASAAQQYWVAAIACFALGLYSFTMPHTPPPSAGKKVSFAESLGLGALPLMRSPAFAIFIIASFLTCIPLMAYYAKAQVFLGDSGFSNPAATMAYGQWAEVVFMLMMPLMFARFGVKWMLAIGMFAWVIRYGLFSQGAGVSEATSIHWMILIGILLHGICYDFFFVTGQIYVDKIAPEKIRGQAQGFLVLMTLGLGSWVGSYVADEMVSAYAPPKAEVEAAAESKATADRIAINLKKYEAIPEAQRSQLDRAALESGRLALQEHRARAVPPRRDWTSIWLWPAGGALAILLVFLAVFRYRNEDERV